VKKLLDGIRDFHQRVRPGYRERFAHLALGQSPDCLFVACSDSRVVPNLFASTDPGDLFVLRNVGNIVPPAGATDGAVSPGAAVEFATMGLGVRDIVVCGHSSCGAMRAALTGELPPGEHLAAWLAFATPSLGRAEAAVGVGLPPEDRLSQLNVLQQLDHLRTYAPVASREAAGTIRLHAWWFDLANAEVLAFDAAENSFLPIVR
jgi:carbonic anhydrase